jgi:hypothetical protein
MGWGALHDPGRLALKSGMIGMAKSVASNDQTILLLHRGKIAPLS